MKKYVQYASEGDWEAATDETVPTILLVCATKNIQKRLRKRIAKELYDTYEELMFATALLGGLLAAADLGTNGKIWLPIDEDGDNPEEPRKVVGLGSI